MTKIIFSILFISTSAFASLMDEVDQLTPEQAYEINQKIQGKILDPVPIEFFTKMSFSMSANYLMADPKVFKNSLDTRFNKGNDLDSVNLVSMDLLWRISESLRLGMEIGYLNSGVSTELASQLFQSINLFSTLAFAKVAYKVSISDSLSLLPYAGIGAVSTRASTETSSDSNTTSLGAVATHKSDIYGSNFGFKVGTSFNYELNKVFSIGLDVSMLQDKVSKLKRSGITEVASPSELDLSGFAVGIKTSVNL